MSDIPLLQQEMREAAEHVAEEWERYGVADPQDVADAAYKVALRWMLEYITADAIRSAQHRDTISALRSLLEQATRAYLDELGDYDLAQEVLDNILSHENLERFT